MSYAADRQWQIDREKRRQLHLARIRETTREFAIRNRERMNSIIEQGLDVYVTKEIAECQGLLSQVERFLTSDPEQARDKNIRLSTILKPLFSEARTNLRADQIATREAEKNARELARVDALEKLEREKDESIQHIKELENSRMELLELVRNFINELPGIETRDFAYDSLEMLRTELKSIEIESSNLAYQKTKLLERLCHIKCDAIASAEEWKVQNNIIETTHRVTLDLLDSKSSFTNLKDTIAVNAVIALQQKFENRTIDPDEVDFELSQIKTESDIRAENEAERSHLVNSLCESLRSTGFTVAPPRFDSKGDNDVIISAKKPSGVEAAFKVKIDGGLIYKFDRYQGQSCLNDAKEVLPKLESIYNIDLTKENVSWRNPDFTSASARQLPIYDQESKK
ncbi:MAG: hypothetical protein RLZZ230_576 [Candidatus Parcubacteria bacterium]|jgi:hypothetical protein